jgi:hypothetical protein
MAPLFASSDIVLFITLVQIEEIVKEIYTSIGTEISVSSLSVLIYQYQYTIVQRSEGKGKLI